MKIAMLGAWNTDSGSSIHAELIGRTWVKKGIDLKIFSFYRHSFHGTTLIKSVEKEEPYVKRCFTVYGEPNSKMDTEVILKADFDIFIVQDLGMVPMIPLLGVFPQIKKKAKTINIIHDGKLSKKPEFFHFNWDSVICFDQRYYSFLKEAYPEDKLRIIPYPAFPLKPGDKAAMRQELKLPQDKKIVLLFGQVAKYALDAMLVLEHLSDKYDIMVVLVTEDKKGLGDFRYIRSRLKFDFKFVEKSPDIDFLYKYLYASDCMIYNKPSIPLCVVASTVFQCMGSGCPIIALESNFVEKFDKEVIKYRNFYELEDNIVDVFDKGTKYQRQQKAIMNFLKNNSAEPIAEKFLKLFETLI